MIVADVRTPHGRMTQPTETTKDQGFILNALDIRNHRKS